MTVAEICEMGKGVQRLSAPNCTLLLWTPASHLDKFPAILEAWGFRYNTCWVWNKIRGNFSLLGILSILVDEGHPIRKASYATASS
jgi:N6-adenosine-specific RNA methylase IME4